MCGMKHKKCREASFDGADGVVKVASRNSFTRAATPHGGCRRTLQCGGLPSLAKEGWPRHQENGSKPPLNERPGWFVQLPIIGGFNEPPRLRSLRKLRDIFLMGAATPPLPRRGVPAHCNVRQQPHEEEIALAQRFSIHSQQ